MLMQVFSSWCAAYIILPVCVYICIRLCFYLLLVLSDLWQHACTIWGVEGAEGVKVPCLLGRMGSGVKHQPLWWGPWSGSQSARACVGCTVMSWQWSAETAAQPRPPCARHRTWARRPSAGGRRGEERRSRVHVDSRRWQDGSARCAQTQSLPVINIQPCAPADLHLFLIFTQLLWISNDCFINILCTDKRLLTVAIVITFCTGRGRAEGRKKDNVGITRTNSEMCNNRTIQAGSTHFNKNVITIRQLRIHL